jgi:hypothetical protein
MSNTYFKIKKTVKACDPRSGCTSKHELTLTAFMGGENHTQLTIQSGHDTSYIPLSDKDVDNLIAGLLERKNKEISATGNEQSKICPADRG